MFDIITIGGATQDTFVELNRARIIDIKNPEQRQSYLCFDYGEKLEVDYLNYDIGGGATNAAVNFSNLGFNASIIAKIGTDLNSTAVLERLKERNVDSSMIVRTDKEKTGFSLILTSFEGDRTVLMTRGANSTITLDDIDWEKIKNTKWMYFASLSGASNQILDKMAQFAEENGINTAFNPGSTQLKRGLEDLRKILETAEILIMNRSEASTITGIPNNPPDYPSIDDENLKDMIYKLKEAAAGIVVITEGKRGVYAFDGSKMYYTPPHPAKVVSTLGAGDSFASTFVGYVMKYGDQDIEKALKYASVNSASVVESYGAQHGLKTFDEIEAAIASKDNL